MISDVYDGVVEAFKKYGCPAQVYLGEQYVAQHTGGLRVIMFQGRSSPADQFTPELAAQLLPSQLLQYINPRPVATRRCGLSVELWATAPKQSKAADQFRANQAYLDALVNQFAVVMQQIVSGIFMVQSGLAAAGNADAVVAGLGYTMQLLIDVPVIDAAWPAQQLAECTKTWAHAPATAEVSVTGPGDNIAPPPFTVPTEDDTP